VVNHITNGNTVHKNPVFTNHLIRQRVNDLLDDAINKPVITVCAGAGYGKTQAVLDFLKQQGSLFFWVQLSESDNTTIRMWENIIDAIKRVDPVMAEQCRAIGFPDTEDKIEKFINFRNETLTNNSYIIVWDDVHLLNEPAAIHFAETIINQFLSTRKMILIGRDLSKINLIALDLKGHVANIRETDLNFTEKELTDYFRKLALTVDSHTQHQIYTDTKGWVFAVNLIARSLERLPNYFGYIRNTFKKNILKLMETESWNTLSEPLKAFLVKLSLIDHLSAELVEILAGEDNTILNELKNANAYIRFDGYFDAYHIHHLFINFLKTKQNQLTEDEKHKTYKTAADWCCQNNFMIDALNYYEKINDYKSIQSIFLLLPLDIPSDVALFAKGIFDRAPAEAFDRVEYFASLHLNAIARLGDVQTYYSLADSYIRKFTALPESDPIRNDALVSLYFSFATMRLSTAYDGNYDFDVYYAKMFDYLTEETFRSLPPVDVPRPPWINMATSSEKGAPQKYIEALIRSDKITARFSGGITAGADLLAQGELLFYQGKTKAAKPFITNAAENATKRMSYETLHRALFYLLRIAVAEGNSNNAETVLRDLESLLDEKLYHRRYSSYDISLGWFQYILRRPEMFPEWLTEKFSPYVHASSAENFGNQIKARYHFLTRNFLPLLSYIKEMKNRESFLYGRIEMLTLEANVFYKMKDKDQAWKSLKHAYDTAAPNDIQIPFIELGKDMRSFIIATLRENPGASCIGIPRTWLESIKHKTISYSKSQSLFINEHQKNDNRVKTLTPREKEVLLYLYNGFSQPEIANKLELSVNTIKMITKILYDKLHVHKISDLVRIAAEQKFT
jgi:LuxR family maltose regulon positive regulatory protein